MEQPIYLHEFQRPTLNDIVTEGCKAIDIAVERVCEKYEAPQISPNPYLEYLSPLSFSYQKWNDEIMTAFKLCGSANARLHFWQGMVKTGISGHVINCTENTFLPINLGAGSS